MPGQARILTQNEIRDLFRYCGTTVTRPSSLGHLFGPTVGEIIALNTTALHGCSGVRNALKVTRLKKNRPFTQTSRCTRSCAIACSNTKTTAQGNVAVPIRRLVIRHLERVRAHYILRSAFDSLRLEDASTHSMRRTCLTNMSRAGIPLRTIQEISGHSSLSHCRNISPSTRRISTRP